MALEWTDFDTRAPESCPLSLSVSAPKSYPRHNPYPCPNQERPHLFHWSPRALPKRPIVTIFPARSWRRQACQNAQISRSRIPFHLANIFRRNLPTHAIPCHCEWLTRGIRSDASLAADNCCRQSLPTIAITCRQSLLRQPRQYPGSLPGHAAAARSSCWRIWRKAPSPPP